MVRLGLMWVMHILVIRSHGPQFLIQLQKILSSTTVGELSYLVGALQELTRVPEI